MNRLQPVFWLLAPYWCLAACSGQSGSEAPAGDDSGGVGFGQGIESASACATAEVRPLTVDEVSPLGFSARDMLDLAAGAQRAELRYADDSLTGLRSVIEYQDGNVFYIDKQRAEGDAGPSSDCPDRLEVTISARLETDDGRFLERYDTVLVAVQANENGYFVELDPARLQGSFEYSDFDSGEADRRRLFIDAVYGVDGTSGRITGQSESDGDPDDPDSSATARVIPIGAWQRQQETWK